MPYKYPHFLIVGTMKSATTTMYDTLICHPQIAAARWKEVNYFSRHREVINEDLWGYEYREALNYHDESQQLHGEASPSYFFDAPLIHEFNPQCKIIIILRNPIDRAISHYAHNKRLGYESLGIQDAFSSARAHLYIRYSVYGDKIKEFAELFGGSQVCVIGMEYFVENTQFVMDGVFSFLGVDPFEVPIKHSNKGMDMPVDHDLPSMIEEKIRSFGAPKTADVIKSYGILTLPDDMSVFETY